MKRIGLLCTLLLAMSGQAVSQAAEAACLTSAASEFAVDSQISQNQVVLCVSSKSSQVSSSKGSITSSKSSKTGNTQTLPIKAKCPSKVTTTPEIIAAALQGCAIPGPSKPPAAKPVIKVVKPLVAQTRQIDQDQAVFEAEPVHIVISESSVSAGQSVFLSSTARLHERSAVVLGRTAIVRFTPVAHLWRIAKSELGGSIAVVAFETPGPATVGLRLTYQASYRFSLSEAWIDVGPVYSEAIAEVSVHAKNPEPVAGRSPRLVFSSCAEHISSYRC